MYLKLLKLCYLKYFQFILNFISYVIFILFHVDLSPSDSSYIDSSPTLHLIVYSVNQKGHSEPTVLEDIAINEAEKRTGTCIVYVTLFIFFYLHTVLLEF